MGLFDDIRAKGAALRITEEILYAEVLREIESGVRRDGIWAKALSESEMREGVAKAKYIKLRVQALKDEVSIALATREAESRIEEYKQPRTSEKLEGVTEGDWIGAFATMVAVLIAIIILSLFLRG